MLDQRWHSNISIYQILVTIYVLINLFLDLHSNSIWLLTCNSPYWHLHRCKCTFLGIVVFGVAMHLLSNHLQIISTKCPTISSGLCDFWMPFKLFVHFNRAKRHLYQLISQFQGRLFSMVTKSTVFNSMKLYFGSLTFTNDTLSLVKDKEMNRFYGNMCWQTGWSMMTAFSKTDQHISLFKYVTDNCLAREWNYKKNGRISRNLVESQ